MSINGKKNPEEWKEVRGKIVEMLLEHKPLKEISATLNVNRTSVSDLRKKLMDQGFDVTKPRDKNSKENKEMIKQIGDLLKSGKTMMEVSGITGKSFATVRRVRGCLVDEGTLQGKHTVNKPADYIMDEKFIIWFSDEWERTRAKLLKVV